MTEIINTNPMEWAVDGNLIPGDLADLESTAPFTGSNSTLTIEEDQDVNDNVMNVLKIIPSW